MEANLERPLAAAMRKIDLFAPLLTGDPTTKAVDIIRDILRTRAASMSVDQGPDRVIRESYITLIILVRLLRLKVLPYNPLAIAEFGKTVSEA